MSEKLSGKLLVIGGDESLRSLFPSIAEVGVEIVTASDVYDALVTVEQERPAWVFLDLSDSENEQLELLTALGRVAPGLPVLVAFPLSRRESAARALTLGAAATLLRPFYLGEVIALLRQHRVRTEEAPFDALEALAGGVAHEINNPLTIVNGWIQMLLRETSEGSRPHRPLDVMRTECDRIAAVVRDLQILAISAPLERQPVKLFSTLLDVVEELRSQDRLAHLRVDLQPSGNLPHVDVDVVQMKKAFRELILNAVDATAPPGGHLVIEVVPGGDEQVVRFIDNGRGIRPENLRRVLLPFFMEGRKEGRRGIGLAIVRGVVEAHGGVLTIASAPGEGTTVEIVLPLLFKGRDGEGPPEPTGGGPADDEDDWEAPEW
jgi:signal transduction histidine kinase